MPTRTPPAIIEEIAKSDASGDSSQRKIADLYNSYMDEKAIDAKGGEPLQPHLKAIADISNKKELAYALGQTLRADVDALNNTNFHTTHLFGLWVAGGFNDPDHYAAYLLQGGVQLPDREYYLSDSEHMKEVRTKYQAHISAMLKLAGFTDTDARAEKIIALETCHRARSISAWPTTTTSTRPTTSGSNRTSRKKLPAWIGRSTSAAPD